MRLVHPLQPAHLWQLPWTPQWVPSLVVRLRPARQGGVMLLNTGSVDVQVSGTVWPMATATRPSLESLLE